LSEEQLIPDLVRLLLIIELIELIGEKIIEVYGKLRRAWNDLKSERDLLRKDSKCHDWVSFVVGGLLEEIPDLERDEFQEPMR